jgi:hypothetical protein
VRNLTLIKCTLGRRMSEIAPAPTAGYGTPVAGPDRQPVMVERKWFVKELPAARIQNHTTDLRIVASASPHERRS